MVACLWRNRVARSLVWKRLVERRASSRSSRQGQPFGMRQFFGLSLGLQLDERTRQGVHRDLIQAVAEPGAHFCVVRTARGTP